MRAAPPKNKFKKIVSKSFCKKFDKKSKIDFLFGLGDYHISRVRAEPAFAAFMPWAPSMSCIVV
jgi:hypothetical protein